mmetsp:Transcript_11376/g.17605  ORF Transcript_11376/g.17605 Transcript_11376/m.17605 type:complete len:919 (-) Transcript_11376:104-2860(-)
MANIASYVKSAPNNFKTGIKEKQPNNDSTNSNHTEEGTDNLVLAKAMYHLDESKNSSMDNMNSSTSNTAASPSVPPPTDKMEDLEKLEGKTGVVGKPEPTKMVEHNVESQKSSNFMENQALELSTYSTKDESPSVSPVQEVEIRFPHDPNLLPPILALDDSFQPDESSADPHPERSSLTDWEMCVEPSDHIMQDEEENASHDVEVGMDVEHISHSTVDIHSEHSAVHGHGRVAFSSVEIREYGITLGDNPCCSNGPPITLDWDYTAHESADLDLYECTRAPRRRRQSMILTYYQRRDVLWRAGHTLEELEEASRETEKIRKQRLITMYFIPVEKAEMVFQSMTRRLRRIFIRNDELDASNHSIKQWNMHGVQPSSSASSSSAVKSCMARSHDAETGGSGSRSSRRSRGSMDHSNSTARRRHSWALGSRSSDHSHDDEHDDPHVASTDSKFDRYLVAVDRKQHDKACEILLCRMDRPHMRAFHAAWFSFFVAFFTWFAVTPLLSDIQDTLDLSKQQVWTSSVCGTAGTILMRILMGPACDKFGARVCMAFILAISAIPTAFTGLVNTSAGLSMTRLFIGIAGSSFVACQYWTSSMFVREVAGTANALVAGWGNLGGGVTQVVMGSVLFPMFKAIYGGNFNDEPAVVEKAWRTVFIIPALLSLFTAYVVYARCDDSPKGSYKDRARLQETLDVNPFDSFGAVMNNRNVWILALQYACCFGVEVTMTNACALYFKEEFGQSTEAAAAIASIFGFMNLFARGFGGFCSDVANMRSGMKGRLSWQFVSLFIQGCGIIVFGYADSLVGAIFALIFTSLFVQSSEGSLFGIVPYVDRRFTGGVVGLVGAGGNLGGVIFAVFFRQFSYETAFLYMGFAAVSSSVLSFFLHFPDAGSFTVCCNKDSQQSGETGEDSDSSAVYYGDSE